MRRDVFVLHTGGTIGMKETSEGLKPDKDNLERQLAIIRQNNPTLPSFDLEHTDTLFDSSQIHPSDWNLFGSKIRERIRDYRGVVVLHGTDTMAYTASALGFMLQGLDRPVVLTGSQRPLIDRTSDGRANFIGALREAARGRSTEVSVAFGGRLIRGVRSTKVSATRDEAFDAPNFTWTPLPTEDQPLTLEELAQPSAHASALKLREVAEPVVVALRFFPGISPSLIGALLEPRDPPLRGIVLEMFGSGNGPTHAGMIKVLEKAREAKVVVVAVSQCVHGAVDWKYAAGIPYARAGVLDGKDMTTEAAVAKLTVFASQNGYEALSAMMKVPVAGEMS